MDKLTTKDIYYLGPQGSYTHKALEQFVKSFELHSDLLIEMRTIKSVLTSVAENNNSFGVIPIENSIEGIVREAIDNLIRVDDADVKIMAEVVLPVEHCLLSRGQNIEDVKTVISHPQALAQCAKYLDEKFDNIHILEETSTSAAAKRISQLDDTYAAIANEMAAKFFDLNILDTSINDEKDNKTRFVLIGRNRLESTGYDKTSISFSTKNIAGALHKVLSVFDKYQLNLLYIDSRPSKKNLGEYMFFIDFEGHCNDEKVSNALGEIQQYITFYRFNGSYPRQKK